MKQPDKYRLLRVTTDYYCAGAVWVKRSGVWAATQTAPILNWMRFKTPAEVHLELLRLGAKWEWIKLDDKSTGPLQPRQSSLAFVSS